MTADGSTKPARPRVARWLDRLSAVLLCLGAGAVVGAAAPPLLRDARPLSTLQDLEEPGSAAPSASVVAPSSTISASDSNPRFAPDDDEPHVTELERLYPDGMWPDRHDADRATPRTNARSAHTRTGVVLRERGDASGRVVGRVPAGQRLMMIREDGAWGLVVYQGADGIAMGWAPKSQLSFP